MAHRRLVVAAVVVGSLVMWPDRSVAQNDPSDSVEIRMTLPASLFTSGMVSAPAAPPVAEAPQATFRPIGRSASLSPGLVSLYASTAALQVLDVHSTYAVIGRGGAEGNPLLAGVVSHKAAFVALKVGVASGMIMAARQVAKRNKPAAVVTLVALNSVYAAVVSHNYQLARQLR